MLLLSGPANTRCSVCLFDLGGLDLVQLRPAPGTGLEGPETGSQNPRYRDLCRRQRLHVAHLDPRKSPQIAGYSSETRKRRFASDCVVVEAVVIEPVSVREIPVIAERTGKFTKIYAGKGTLGADSMPELKGLTAFSRGARDGN